jgi:hypothetical protein
MDESKRCAIAKTLAATGETVFVTTPSAPLETIVEAPKASRRVRKRCEDKIRHLVCC